MLKIQLTNHQDQYSVESQHLVRAVRQVLTGEGVRQANVGIAIVDKVTICKLNRRYLNHDYPTDVLSCPYSPTGSPLEGEIVLCAEVANQNARRFGTAPDDEMLLYAVHGALHLVGYDDQTAADRQAVEEKQQYYVSILHSC